jgi:hypothetical protein
MSAASQPSLMGFWSRHKTDCRPIGSIVADARTGKLPGVEPLKSGYGFAVVDEAAALAAMKAS